MLLTTHNFQLHIKDFMFQLTKEERDLLRSQFVTFSTATARRKYVPYVFTEQGIAMLSSVLNSDSAIQVNITIMRVFVKIRHFLASDESLAEKLTNFEKGTTKLFRVVFERLEDIEGRISSGIADLSPRRKRIGLKKGSKENES